MPIEILSFVQMSKEMNIEEGTKIIDEASKETPLYKSFSQGLPFLDLTTKDSKVLLKREEGEDVFSTLVKQFGIRKQPIFKKAYEQVVAAVAPEELLDLSSPYLCALLHFFDYEGVALGFILGEDDFVVDEVSFAHKSQTKEEKEKEPIIEIVFRGHAHHSKKRLILFLASSMDDYELAKKRIPSDLVGIRNDLIFVRDGGQINPSSVSRDIKDGAKIYYGSIVFPSLGTKTPYFQLEREYRQMATLHNKNLEFIEEREDITMLPYLLAYTSMPSWDWISPRTPISQRNRLLK